MEGQWYQPLRVEIRRDTGHEVRQEAEQLDGKTYLFRYGWKIESGIYTGEIAWVPFDANWPADAPIWVASGDLVQSSIPIEEKA